MNITIAGAEQAANNKQGVNLGGVSIPQKNAQLPEIGNFGNAIIGHLNNTKMNQNTYESLLKEADDIKAQLQNSAATAKDNLKALFMRLSGADAVKLDEEGFDLTDASPEQCVNIVDRIKIELARHSDGYVPMGSSVSADKIAEVVGSAGYAQEIAGKLSAANMPATQENIAEITGVLEKVAAMSPMTDAMKNTLIAQGENITIDNLYLAQHQMSESATKNVNPVSDADFEALRPQIEQVLGQAQLPADAQHFNTARMFMEQDIPVTAKNLAIKDALDSYQLPDVTVEEERSALVDQIIAHMTTGENAGSTPILGELDVITQVADSLDVLERATYQDVARLADTGEVFTIGTLKAAMQSATSGNTDRMQTVSQVVNASKNTEVQNDKTAKQADVYYRQLQECRILMTAQSGAFLAKQGINLYTTPIAELTKQLYAYDSENFAKHYEMTAQETPLDKEALQIAKALAETGVAYSDGQAPVYTEQIRSGNVSYLAYQAAVTVRSALTQIQFAPDVTIGAVLKDKEETEAVTITDFAAMGNDLHKRYNEAEQTYEAVGTQIRKDLGDSMKKAVLASTDGILEELHLDNTTANADAVRILAANEMDMTSDNIAKVKEAYTTLQNLIGQMSPDKVLEMIRQHINPMQHDIRDLNEQLTVDSDTQNKIDKYSKFLYKLEKTNGITKEERAQFIGIYKMMNLFTKDAGAAVGALMKQGADLTMGNLYTAYVSRKSYGMDAQIGDETGVAQSHVNYFTNLFSQAGNYTTPLTLKAVQDESPIAQRSAEEFCEAVMEQYDADAEAAQYEEYVDSFRENLFGSQSRVEAALAELERTSQVATLHNIQAAQEVMRTELFETMQQALSEISVDFRAYAKEWFDRLDEPQGVEHVTQKLSDTVEEKLSQMIADAPTAENAQDSEEELSYTQVMQARQIYREIGYIQNLNKRNDYRIPIAIGEKIATMNLTLVQDEDNKGRISIAFEQKPYGKVSVEAKVAKDSIDVYAVSNATDMQPVYDWAEAAKQQLEDTFGYEQVQIHVGSQVQPGRITYSQDETHVPSERLYQVAKSLLGQFHG